MYSFLPSPGEENMLNFGTTQIYGLTEVTRDCDVTCQLMCVTVTSPGEQTTEDTAEESVYANTTPVGLRL